MTKKKMTGLILAAVSACAAFATPVFAKESNQDIIIYAPPSAHGPVAISRAVSYKDLDLRYDRHVEILRDRITHTAAYACGELRDQFRSDCISDAVRGATPQLRDAVARARG